MGDQNGSKFSLAFTNKAKKKISLHDEDTDTKKEIITRVEEGGIQTIQSDQHEKRSTGPKIIPKQENTYRSGSNKFKPSFIPQSTAEDETKDGITKFETSDHDTTAAQEKVIYGLIKREPTQEQDNNTAQHQDRDAQVLKQDLDYLPPVASLEAYEAMPVESFGEALLRGMGWKEGQAIGRNTKEEVVAREVKRRPHRLGLGAEPAPPPPSSQKKILKPGESRPPSQQQQQPSNHHNHNTNNKSSTTDKRQRQGIYPGNTMYITHGSHSGLKCEIIAILPREEGRSERASVRLIPSYEKVTVRCSDLTDENDYEYRGNNSNGRDSGGGEYNDSRSGKKAREERHDDAYKKKQHRDDDDEKKDGREERPWLVANIRVKIIDKKVGKGRFYLKKGRIVDVKTPTMCDVFVEDIQETVLDIHQSQLETVVPNDPGTPLIVVSGKYTGHKGRLLQRNTQTGMAAVRFCDDMNIHKLHLDDVCQYCGPTDDWDDESLVLHV